MAKMKCKAKALDVHGDPKTVDIFNISVVEIVQDKIKGISPECLETSNE